MTQVSEDPPLTGLLVPPQAPDGPDVATAPGPGRPAPAQDGAPVRVEPGTLMEKLIPRHLVEPYLTSQRSVIAGFVRRAQGGADPLLSWADGAVSAAGRHTAGESGDRWVLRWRALQLQTYLTPPAVLAGELPDGLDGIGAPGSGWLLLGPGPVPVDTEMYRITTSGEEFVARHDGQAWLRPAPRD